MNVKVQFDHQIFSLQKYGGISRYFAALLNNISEASEITTNFKLLYSDNAYLSNKYLLSGRKFIKKIFNLQDAHSIYKWNRRYEKRTIFHQNFDVFHPTYFDPYFTDFVKKPVVVTVHDMIYEKFPQYFDSNDPTALQKRQVIGRADHIIAISESTKRDLQDILNISSQNISVIHHGLFSNHSPITKTEQRSKISLMPRFILFVGTRNGYKNFNMLINSLKPIMNKQNDITLVCTGGGAFSYEERHLFESLNFQNRVVQIAATEDQLYQLYQEAMLFVFPSLYEGFGLPILEAFYNNCPVAVSDTSCFREIAGDAAAYFNPYSADDMTSIIEKLILSESDTRELVIKGKQRLQYFSSDDCIIKTQKVYEMLAGK